MQPNKLIRPLFIALVLAAVILPRQLLAQGKEITVTMPGFPVTLNGIQVDNTYRQYPLIVYKDITYFPMTYYDNRFLGVETNWSGNSGLVINQTGVSAAYRDYKWGTKNSKSFKAAIRTGTLQLNGKVIDSGDGQYPFLTFRDVTYFPLTWQYAVDELGWNYSFDSRNGLVIRSSNPQVKKITPAAPVPKDGIAVNGFYYYKGEKGTIVQAPIDQPSKSKVVYRLPIWDYGDGTTYVNASLSIKEGEVWLYYHQGGAVMGGDHYLKLNADGVFEEVESGYLAFKTFGDIKVKVNQNPPPGPNNLYVATKGEDLSPAGDPAYLYGWTWSVHDGVSGGSSSADIYLVDHQLYLLAFNMEKDTDYSRIHKVDLATNTTTRVSDLKTENFAVIGDSIYLVSEGKLVKLPMDGSRGTREEVVPIAGKVSWIKVEDGYLIVAITKDNAAPYGMIVIDAAGSPVFKTSDSVGSVSVLNGNIVYSESVSGDTYSAVLPRSK